MLTPGRGPHMVILEPLPETICTSRPGGESENCE
jgi:hypothetical protein